MGAFASGGGPPPGPPAWRNALEISRSNPPIVAKIEGYLNDAEAGSVLGGEDLSLASRWWAFPLLFRCFTFLGSLGSWEIPNVGSPQGRDGDPHWDPIVSIFAMSGTEIQQINSF